MGLVDIATLAGGFDATAVTGAGESSAGALSVTVFQFMSGAWARQSTSVASSLTQNLWPADTTNFEPAKSMDAAFEEEHGVTASALLVAGEEPG